MGKSPTYGSSTRYPSEPDGVATPDTSDLQVPAEQLG